MTLPRNLRPELMDDPRLPESDHRQALAGLSRLNRVSGVAGALYRRLARHARALDGKPLRILDVASGRGDLPLFWAKKARQDGLRFRITATDISPLAVDEQQRAAQAAGVELVSLQRDCLRDPLPSGFDVITCSLFMHHLQDVQVTRLLRSMQGAANRGLLICDLERSRMNLGLVGLGARVLSRSYVVHHDAVWSVRGAYTCEEFSRLAEAALLRPVVCHRLFPCRFIVTVDDATVLASTPAFA